MTDRHPGRILAEVLAGSAPFRALLAAIGPLGRGDRLDLCGVPGSLAAAVLAALQEHTGRPIFALTADSETAERLRDDLGVCHGPGVGLFTGGGGHARDPHARVEDIEALRTLGTGTTSIIVCTAEGLQVPVPPPGTFQDAVLRVEKGAQSGFSGLLERLDAMGFERKPFVESPGDYAVRGGIVDVFPFVGESPVRLEFFGDEVESLREFDPLSQRSIRELASALIVPNLLAPGGPAAARVTDLLDPRVITVLLEPGLVARAVGEERWPSTDAELARSLRIDINPLGVPGAVDFGAVSQPAFNGSIAVVHRALAEYRQAGRRVLITCDSASEMQRLRELLAGLAGEIGIEPADPDAVEFSVPSFTAGFVAPSLGFVLLTEHQIFQRLRRRPGGRRARARGLSAKELRQLRPGDYVVHTDYGIGRFSGLTRITVNGVEQEVLRLLYEENDTLYVNLTYITRVQKYSSREGHVPTLSRLGRPDWERLKGRVRKRVRDIARDLIGLYAARKGAHGFAAAPDTPWQKELEASFLYEDTFDQAKTTREVKADMEAPHPMDRLVCGDVGFGKTEVAVRAAFKTVMNGKQVALLVPTTILAVQHLHTFQDRLGRYATRVEAISRFVPRARQEEILGRLKAGAVDILIGTHRILSRDVAFRDLGLLIIDEEHRFGVAAKEKLRRMKSGVDTLTLTATPIPRTLHFSLMGARDLSIIATPPRNRLPVITEIAQATDELLREGIMREVQRGGQAYIVHDRVQDIDAVTLRLRNLLPAVRFRSAHGQMPSRALETVMVDFLEKRFDVLVCTKIIESGLDIPNVNTIIIIRADRFGMAELYQLRGRVGRSNVQAYAYLLVPPVESLPRPTLRRLQALEEFTELGAGFHLAMRDLEIRGAGNLLGAEQSGFIESMGFETYTRIIEEAVAELRETEFREVFAGQEGSAPRREPAAVEVGVPAFIPRDYIESDDERLDVYRRLYGVESIAQLEEMAAELRDRFGLPPEEALHLLAAVRLRLTASRIGFARVTVHERGGECDFPPSSDTRFYESARFQEIMDRIASGGSKGISLLTEGKTLRMKLRLVEPVEDSIGETRRILEELLPAGENPGG
jgi:transcription-repair coupling factor (superfamily II helicase)